jgi:hypothetical protein
VVRILFEPVKNAEMEVRGREARLQLDGAFKMRLRLGAAIEHGQQKTSLILQLGRLGIGGCRLPDQSQRPGGISPSLQHLRLLLQLRRRLAGRRNGQAGA